MDATQQLVPDHAATTDVLSDRSATVQAPGGFRSPQEAVITVLVACTRRGRAGIIEPFGSIDIDPTYDHQAARR